MASAQEIAATSPSFPNGVGHRRSAGDVRGRKLYLDSLAAFRSNVLDAADLAGPGVKAELHAFLRNLDAIAPTSENLDAASAAAAEGRPSNPLPPLAMLEAPGNGRALR